MNTTLGLDLGSNSIGWALIDEKNQKIIDMGVRIFPEGLNRDKGQEKSRNEGRRAARGIRRQTFRRKMRKKLLLDILYEQSMTPITKEEIKNWWQGDDFPDSSEIQHWLALNPYELRAKGLDEKLSLFEFGRVLYHLIQRRGFKSNRLAGSTDEESTIYTGKDGVTGIIETREKSDNYQTLGQFLNTLTAETGQPYSKLERIRNRYTTRRMYINEFEALWNEQSKYHPEIFTHKLRTRLGGRKTENSPDDKKYDQDGVLFHQRPLRSQKFLVGKCTFEPNKTRCPKGAIEYELFRAWQQINNVKYRGEFLSDVDRRNLFKIFTRKGKVTVSLVKKALGKPANDPWVQLGEDDKNLSGCPVLAFLTSEEAFGNKWKSFQESEKDKIWNLLYFAEDPDWLERRLLQEWDIAKDQAQKIAKFRLPDGYGSLSRKAIRNILPFLEKGYTYDKAVLLGGVKNASGNQWKEIESEYFDTLENIIGQEKPPTRIVHEIRDILRDHAGFTEKQLSKLYHHSTTVDKQELLDKLPHGPNA
ncbi:MAG: type II CRISPR RNA-guided endonuclease Cas9, partial [Cyclonatronaceae bacterium]